MGNRRFILGLGSQKCGTTWLHTYLDKSPLFDGGVAKEYHIWDALDIPILKDKIANIGIKNRIGIGRESKNYLRYRMQNYSEYYFKYFESIFIDNICITGDITPSYSGLGVERIRYIKEGFSDLGTAVLPIILIRDPLSRIKSAVRFNLDREKYHEGIKTGERTFENALRQYYRSEHCIIRTSYNNIIENARNVFGKEGVYIGIYENMFEPNKIKELSEFIGIDPIVDFGNVRVKKTKSSVEKTKIDEEVREYYRKVYNYCNNEIPDTISLWE